MKKGFFCKTCNQIFNCHICLNDNIIEEPFILYKCNCMQKKKKLSLFIKENINEYDYKKIKCKNHNKCFIGYCLSCNKNFCDECKLVFHDNLIEHKIIMFENIFSQNFMFDIKNNFQKAKNKISSNYFLLKCQADECLNSENYLNDLETFYNKNKEINLKILGFLDLIYQMFDLEYICYEIIKNIYNNSFFNLSVIKSKDIRDYINYFKKEYIIYSIKENDIFLLSKLIFSENIDSVENILILSNGKIALSSKNLILIYNQNSFSKEQEIESHQEKINDLYESKDKKLFSCSSDFSINIFVYDSSMNLYKIEKSLVEHKNEVLKIIELNNGNFVSCSNDNYLYFRESKSLDFIYKTIYLDNFRINSIENFNNHIYITSRLGLKILNIDSYKIKNMINEKNDFNIFSPNYYNIFFGKQSLEIINNNLILYKTPYELIIINDKNLQIQTIINIGNAFLLQHAFILKIFNGDIYFCRVDGFLQIYSKNLYKEKFGKKGIFTYFKKGISIIEKVNENLLISYDYQNKQLNFLKK
jgi:WD40 repeat protein